MNTESQEEYADLRKKLMIHPTGLHEDAKWQPDLAARAGELTAELKAGSKRAKIRLEEIRAATATEVRRNPEKFGLEKTTEAAVGAAVTCDERVSTAAEKSIDADRDADRAAVVANSYEHRRSMLKLEVELYTRNYFGEVVQKEMTGAEDTVDRKDGDQHNERPNESKRRRRRRETQTETAPPTAE